MDQVQIIQQYRSAFRKQVPGIIDLDQQFRMKCNFQLCRLEKFITQVSHTIPPFRQSDFYIKLIRKGEGEMTVGHYRFPIKDHLLVIVPPRVIQSSRYEHVTSSGYVLTFNMDFFLQHAFPRELIMGKKILQRSVKPYGYINAEKEKQLVEVFEAIENEQQLSGSAMDE